MGSRQQTVCVVGAGPAGLVAAKNFLRPGFHVTVLEANSRIGGLWPLEETDHGMVNPYMYTNQSRHTVSFSDLAWEETTLQFPRAWHVGQYLERYRKTYGIDVRLNTKLVRSEPTGGGWKVWMKSEDKAVEFEAEFDYLVVATGFFGKPKIPREVNGTDLPIAHSSEVRDLRNILTARNKQEIGPGKKILVIGGQMSGIETSASIASMISSAAYSPEESTIRDVAKYEVVHIMQRPTWIFPLFTPKDAEIEVPGEDSTKVKKKNAAPHILPIDLVGYNLSTRPPGPIANFAGHITPEAAQIAHGMWEVLIGTDQSDLDISVLSMTGEARSDPVYLATSDEYHEFVRHGKIKVGQGRLSGVSETSNTVTIRESSGNTFDVTDVAAIICATGFDASPSLDFLPKDVLEELQFTPQDDGFPLALNFHSTATTKFPSLGFVGFYRSPYWGVLEMQARFLAKLWSGDEKVAAALREDTTIDTLISLRTDPRRSQFPMGDYVYLMESFADALDIKRTEPPNSETGSRTGVIFPFRYLLPDATSLEKSEVEAALKITEDIFNKSANSARFVARAVFRGLQGIWSLSRTIRSQIASFPSGELQGKAEFHPRKPTVEGKDLEYLYLEEGEFKTFSGGTMQAKRSYIYHYTELSDTLDVWFVKPDSRAPDYFFHKVELDVEKDQPPNPERPWRAKSSHLCIDDMYNVTYEFYFSGAMLKSWKSRYDVKGPNKDYMIENEYTRPPRVR